MARFFIRLGTALAILLTGGICASWLASMREPPRVEEPREIPLSVEVLTAEFGEYTVMVGGYGTVRSARRVSMSPEVGGRVVYTRRALKAGEIVDQGELLFRIDRRVFELASKSAEADIARLKSQIALLKQQELNDRRRLKIVNRSVELARSRHLRLKELFETEGVGTLSEVEAAEGTLVMQENQAAVLENLLTLYPSQLEELTASLDAAEIKRSNTLLDLEKTEIIAPFRGRLANVSVEEGQLLIPGQPILTLVDDANLEIPVSLDSMEVEHWLVKDQPFDVSSNDCWYSQVAGAKALIHWTEAPEDFSWQGTLDRVERFSPESRTVIAVVRMNAFRAQEGQGCSLPLAEGMFCTVDIPARYPVRCVRLPRTAVSHERTVHTVKKNRLQIKPVELVFEDTEYAYIQGNLDEGEMVIITRLVSPTEGRLLDIVPDAALKEE
jgi:multidrug efflux system membrane fusion protein